jgi:hypothetical protein
VTDEGLLGGIAKMAGKQLAEVAFRETPKNIRNQVVSIFVLLQTAKSHFRARDVLLWVLEVVELGIIISISSSDQEYSTQVPNIPEYLQTM